MVLFIVVIGVQELYSPWSSSSFITIQQRIAERMLKMKSFSGEAETE